MSLKYGASEISALSAVLDAEYADLAAMVKVRTKQIKESEEGDPTVEELERLNEANLALMGQIHEFAESALDAMEEIFEKRAKFVVVGQLAFTKELGEIKPHEDAAIKLSLGWYSTEGDAIKAAESLWSNAATGDQFRCWILPVHHGTPADLHAQRKGQYQEAEAKRADIAKAKLQDQITKRQEADAIRAAGGKGACECRHQQYDHSMVGNSRGKCLEAGCECEKWSERKS